MSIVSDIVVVVVAAVVIISAVVLSLIGRHKDKKKGNGGCNGDCSNCKGCDK